MEGQGQTEETAEGESLPVDVELEPVPWFDVDEERDASREFFMGIL